MIKARRLVPIALGCSALLLVPQPSLAHEAAAAAPEEQISLAEVNGVSLAYTVTGPADGRPILLIPGIGMQLIEWPPEIVAGLVGRGYRVIAFEPRDTGASTHFTSAGVPDFAALFAAMAAGEEPPLAYIADDMVRDTIGLLDRLDLDSVDILGISGGATLGALLALESPERVRSLTLIAANSGNPAIAIPADPARMAGLPQPHHGETAAEGVARRLATARALASPAGGFDEPRMRVLMERAAERDRDPFGSARQGAALLALGDLRARLASVEAPTLVIHGEDDPLIAPQLGREVAEAIPDAEYRSLAEMGHDIPAALAGKLVEMVARNAQRTD